MYFNKKGFLLTDALISIFTVSILALCISTSISSHVHVNQSIQSVSKQMNERITDEMKGIEACEICTEDETEKDSS